MFVKTMCLGSTELRMPEKEEHAVLLFNGLGHKIIAILS